MKVLKLLVLFLCGLCIALALSAQEECYAYKQKKVKQVCAKSGKHTEYDRYAKNLLDKFVKEWNPPIGNGPVDTMKLRMFIRKNGAVYGQRIARPTGLALMNSTSLNVIKRLKKTEQLPKGAPAYVVAELLFFRQHKFTWDVELFLYSPEGNLLCEVIHQ